MTNRQARGARPGGGAAGGIIGNIFGFLCVAAVIAGVGFFIVYNDIRSPDDVLNIAKKTQSKITGCKDAGGDPVDCLKAAVDGRPVGAPGQDNSIEAQLAAIPLSEPDNSGFAINEWPHWLKPEGECDTRENILRQQGKAVNVNDKCAPISGEWSDRYTGQTITDPAQVNIDHIVPMEYAAKHGASTWDTAQKAQFANDVANLATVSAETTADKAGNGPSAYIPGNKAYQCQYGVTWVTVANRYGLSITVADRDALQQLLAMCAQMPAVPESPIPPAVGIAPPAPEGEVPPAPAPAPEGQVPPPPAPAPAPPVAPPPAPPVAPPPPPPAP